MANPLFPTEFDLSCAYIDFALVNLEGWGNPAATAALNAGPVEIS